MFGCQITLLHSICFNSAQHAAEQVDPGSHGEKQRKDECFLWRKFEDFCWLKTKLENGIVGVLVQCQRTFRLRARACFQTHTLMASDGPAAPSSRFHEAMQRLLQGLPPEVVPKLHPTKVRATNAVEASVGYYIFLPRHVPSLFALV